MLLRFGLASFLALAALAQTPDFGREVHPILNRRCAACHSQSAPQGGLSVMSVSDLLKGGASGPSLLPRESAQSLLVRRITGEHPPRMPLGGRPLSDAEVDTIRRWIDAGAPVAAGPQRTWTAPLAPRTPAVPEGSHPVDAFLKSYWREKKIDPGPIAADAVFARRVYLDLHGVPPAPRQLSAFVNDASPNKRASLIRSLLAGRKAYAEHWISFWNDLLHNDEGVVYHGERKSISAWLLNALESNMPYDRFVAELLNPAAATGPEGFLMGVNWRGDINASQTPAMQAAQNSAQVFLGVNIKCASCHDSFINRWKLKDSYGLASFFSDRQLALVRCDAKTGEMSQIKFLFPDLGSVSEGMSAAERRAAAAQLFTKSENGRFTRTFVNRIWQRLLGRGFVDDADDMDGEPWHPDLLDWLAADFANNKYDVQRLLELILTSTAYQLPSIEAEGPFRGPAPRRLTAEQLADSVSVITGEWRTTAPLKSEPARYVRDWRLKASPLARAMGRPVRDLAVTHRTEEPSTLQAMELANGATLATQLRRGAVRLAGEWKQPPQPLFDSGVTGAAPAEVDVALSGVPDLYLLAVDSDSYDAGRVIAGWADVTIETKAKPVALQESAPKNFARLPLTFRKETTRQGVLAPLGSAIRISARGATRLRGRVGVDEKSLASDINPRVRFFVFAAPPDLENLIPAMGPPPFPALDAVKGRERLVGQLFEHAWSRKPSAKELGMALDLANGGTPGIEDLLWMLVLSPEFQFIR